MNKNLSLAYQLGYFIGEVVWPKLPTLNIDMLKSRNVIDVSSEEFTQARLLEETWFSNYRYDKSEEGYDESEAGEKNTNWINLTNFRRKMEAKYLPHVFETYIPRMYQVYSVVAALRIYMSHTVLRSLTV